MLEGEGRVGCWREGRGGGVVSGQRWVVWR